MIVHLYIQGFAVKKITLILLLIVALGFSANSSGLVFEMSFTTNTLAADSLDTETWGIAPRITMGYEFAISKNFSLSLNLDYMKINPDLLLYDLVTTGTIPILDTIKAAINKNYLSFPIVMTFLVPRETGSFRFELSNQLGLTDLANDNEDPKTTVFVGARFGGEFPTGQHHMLIHTGYEFGYHTINHPDAPKQHIFTVLSLAFRLNTR